MILKHVEIQGLYGSMNAQLTLNADVNMLVGINGTGKTSVLNAIDWLLTPNLAKLYAVAFKKLALKFDYGAYTYVITAKKTKTYLTLSMLGGEDKLAPISVPLFSSDDLAEGDRELQFRNSRLSLEKSEVPLWEKIKSFPKPIVITLDRTITAEADNELFQESPAPQKSKMSRPRSPINHVEEVTRQKYADFRRNAIQNDNELKASLMMSSLRAPSQGEVGTSTRRMTEVDIAKLKTKIKSYLSGSFKLEDVQQQVDSFFDALNKIEQNYTNRSNALSLVRHFRQFQYDQVENLAQAFKKFETKNASAFRDLQKYLESINEFFKDSNKTLFFDEVTGRLCFSTGETAGGKFQKKSIEHLSSGERQILILFTFLAFIAKGGTVFIVDEPEISLHPKWQSEFMNAFLKLCPENTQLLLATHSPEIVGNFKHKCVTPLHK